MTFAKTVAAAVAVLAIAGCAQQEEEVMFVEEEPIFAKDGTIIGSRPAVSGGTGGDGMASDMSGDDMDMDMDDDDDSDDEEDG